MARALSGETARAASRRRIHLTLRANAAFEATIFGLYIQAWCAVFGNSGGGEEQLGSDDFAQFINSASNHLSKIARSWTESLCETPDMASDKPLTNPRR
jgi:hypothetical protein